MVMGFESFDNEDAGSLSRRNRHAHNLHHHFPCSAADLSSEADSSLLIPSPSSCGSRQRTLPAIPGAPRLPGSMRFPPVGRAGTHCNRLPSLSGKTHDEIDEQKVALVLPVLSAVSTHIPDGSPDPLSPTAFTPSMGNLMFPQLDGAREGFGDGDMGEADMDGPPVKKMVAPTPAAKFRSAPAAETIPAEPAARGVAGIGGVAVGTHLPAVHMSSRGHLPEKKTTGVAALLQMSGRGGAGGGHTHTHNHNHTHSHTNHHYSHHHSTPSPLPHVNSERGMGLQRVSNAVRGLFGANNADRERERERERPAKAPVKLAAVMPPPSKPTHHHKRHASLPDIGSMGVNSNSGMGMGMARGGMGVGAGVRGGGAGRSVDEDNVFLSVDDSAKGDKKVERLPSVKRGGGGGGGGVGVGDGLGCDALVDAICNLMSAVTTCEREPGQVTKFDAVSVPGIPVRDYFIRLSEYCYCSPTCHLLSLIYIDRLVKRVRDFRVDALNIHRLLVTTTMIAAKFYDDKFHANSFYAHVGGVSTREMNRLEVRLLSLLDYRLVVSPEEFAQYTQYVMSLASMVRPTSCPLPSSTIPPPDADTEPPRKNISLKRSKKRLTAA